MKYLLFLLCFQAIVLKECEDSSPKYKCLAEKLQDDKCLMFDSLDRTYYLKSCSADQKCIIIPTENKNEMGYCVNRLRRKFGKEKCKINAECYSGFCENGYCESLPNGAECKSSNECLSTSYCHKTDKRCYPLLLPMGKCSDDSECPAGYACGSTETATSNKYCMQMFSLPVGKLSTNRLLCETGFVHKYNTKTYSPFANTDGICSTSRLISEETCTTKSICKYDINGGGEFITKEAKGECNCSTDGLTGYCTITTENEVWQNYLKEYKNALDGITVDDDQNSNYLRDNCWGKPKLMQAEANAKLYAEFKKADECAIRYLSSSKFINSSLALLIVLFTILM